MTYVNLEDAVKAVGGVPMRLENGSIRHPLSAIVDAVFALRALPTVSVTDEMVNAAAVEFMIAATLKIEKDVRISELTKDELRMIVSAALEAAIGATVSDGWEDIATYEGPDNEYRQVWCQCEDSGVGWTTAAYRTAYGQWFNDLEGYIPVKGFRPLPAPPSESG